MPRILIVESDRTSRQFTTESLERAGYTVSQASTARDALARCHASLPDLVVLDLILQDGTGIEVLQELKALWPWLPVIISTAYPEIRSVVESMRRGALDYLVKPVDAEALAETCRAALPNTPPMTEPTSSPKAPVELIGESEATQNLREAVQRIARSHATAILITGEPGVGKQRTARAIHAAGARAGSPFLVLDCHVIPTERIEGEMFGRPGLLQVARDGVLVLDGIEQLPHSVQIRLSRFLEPSQAQQRRPLMIGLGERDLEDEIASGRVLEPFGAQLRRLRLPLLPLQKRSEDILPLARHFLKVSGAALGRPFEGFTPDAEDRLLAMTWPGNVRQLEHVIERICLMTSTPWIGSEHLALAEETPPPPWAPTGAPRSLPEVVGAYIEHVVAVTGGNKARAARMLGISRETLRAKLRNPGTGEIT
ncbi:MAG: sigma-54-dependent transcriptional regulator [Candidatus Methylomirabilia bacterium]